MPLMSEGKSGPSRSKLRSIWRREAKSRAEFVAVAASKVARGKCPAVTLETIATIDGWMSGRSTPVGIIPAEWRSVCDEMNAKAQAAAEPAPPAGCLF